MLQQEDILDNRGKAGVTEGTIQTSFQEWSPFLLQCLPAAHIALNTEAWECFIMWNPADVPQPATPSRGVNLIEPPLYRTKCTTLHSECGWSLAETVADSYWSFEIHLADTGHSRHHDCAVEVVLHGIFTEEQVDLVIIAVLALKTLLHKVQVNKVWFWNYEEKSLFTLNCAWDSRGLQRGGTHHWARSSWTQCAEWS